MSAIKVGINQTNADGWMFSTPFNERFVGAVNNTWTEMTGAFGTDVGVLPSANLDGDKWPKSVPTAGHYVRREIYLEAGQTYDVAWTGDFADHIWASDITENSWDAVNRVGSITVSASPSQPFHKFVYTITDPVNYARNIKVTLHGSSGRFTTKYLTELNRYNGTLRFVKWIPSAEQTGGSLAAWGGGTKASPVYVYTQANRNTPTGGSWLNSYSGASVPIEVMVECANAYTGDAVHFNMPYQAADDWITYCANYVRDNLTGGKMIYIELGNETSFNGLYDSYHQCQNEAIDPTLVAGVAISSITKGTPFSLGTTGNISTGSTTISGIASLTGVTPGMTVAGTGIPANTVVKQVFSGQVTISLAATATTTGVSLTFSGCPATLVTSSAHGLSATEVGAITGASPADYNTTFTQLVVVNSTTLTITCPTTPATNATTVGAYTHSGYPSMGVGTIPGYLRYIDASRRMADIWTTAFAGQTSRIKPMLCWQHVDPASTGAALNYALAQGWLTNFKAYASAPYWSASPTYNATYTGTPSAFFTAARSNIDTTMYNNAVSHASNAATYGLEYVTYEGDYGHDINDLTTLTNIKTDAGMYDTVLYYYQKMQLAGLGRVCAFNFCQPLGVPDGIYGHIFPSVLGVTVNKTNVPGLQAIVDYLAGVRTPLPLSTSGLSVATSAVNGDSLGSVTGKDVNSTLTLAGLYGSDGGNVAINGSTGQVTVANSAGLTVGTHNITIRDTNAGYPAPGYVDTNFTYSVSLAPHSDNFNDGTMDATLWQKDTTILAGAHGVTTTGVTVSETGGALTITSSASTSAQQNGYTTLNTIDLTQLPDHYCKISSISGSNECYPLVVGKSGGATVRPRISGATFALDHYDTAGIFHVLNSGTGSFSWSTTPWVRLHYDPTGGTSSGAPISTITHSTTTATVTTTEAHNMAAGMSVTVTGATPAAYNVTSAAITVIDATHYSYTMLSDPGANASVVGSYTFTPSGQFTFYSAPSTASNPPASGDWTVVPNLSNSARPFDVPTTALLAFLKNGATGTFAIDCYNTASG
jgi:hypothetical protein